MEAMRLIDFLLAIIGTLLSFGYLILINTLRKNSAETKENAAQSALDIKNLATQNDTKVTYLAEKNERDVKELAALVMAEKEKTAALVMQEKEKAAVLVKAEIDKLTAEHYNFRIKAAEDLARTTWVKELLTPIISGLDELKKLLGTKLDKMDFERHEDEERRGKIRQ